MKLFSITLLTLTVLIGNMFGQVPDPTYFIKGDMSIRYYTRTSVDDKGNPNPGVKDRYTFDINIANSAKLRGNIEQTPFIKNSFSANQEGGLNYLIECDVVNPKNPAQTRNVGRVFGMVPIDKNNVYHFDDGNLKTAVFSIGSAKGFESSFKGTALGKPPVTKSGDGFLSKLKKEALNITKVVNGKAVTVAVSNYDRMDFQKVVVASGPVGIYPEFIINGALIYDYGRTAWYFESMTIAYVLDGRQYVDKLSGSIRWVESPLRATNGEGQYEFDIRVNEPSQSETSVFSGPVDESAFFATDNSIPALTGTMKYKDTLSGERVTSSSVTVDLSSSKLSKQQVMYLSKILFFITIVPLNAE